MVLNPSPFHDIPLKFWRKMVVALIDDFGFIVISFEGWRKGSDGNGISGLVATMVQ